MIDQLDKKKLGQFLQRLRKTRDLSLEEMGNLLHVSGRTIRRWENAEVTPTIDDIFNICKEFNISIENFLTYIDANEHINEGNTVQNDSNHENTKTYSTPDEMADNTTQIRDRKKIFKWVMAIIILFGVLFGMLYRYAITHNQTVSKDTSSLKSYRTDKTLEGVSIAVKSDGKTLIIAIANYSDQDISFYGTSSVNPELYMLLTDGWHRVYNARNPAGALEPTRFIQREEVLIITIDCIKAYGGILAPGEYTIIVNPVGNASGFLSYKLEFTII